jgi:CBS domain-containing protein
VKTVVSAKEGARLSELAELTVAHGLKRLPILRGDRLVGIVRRSDLLGAIALAPAMLG